MQENRLMMEMCDAEKEQIKADNTKIDAEQKSFMEREVRYGLRSFFSLTTQSQISRLRSKRKGKKLQKKIGAKSWQRRNLVCCATRRLAASQLLPDSKKKTLKSLKSKPSAETQRNQITAKLKENNKKRIKFTEEYTVSPFLCFHVYNFIANLQGSRPLDYS